MGGILDNSVLVNASIAYQAAFLSRLAELPQLYKKLATIIENPNSASLSLNWIADIPGMKEWLGDRQIEKLRAFNYSITHKDWEATLEINKRDLSRDKMGLIMPRINAMGDAYEDHLQALVDALLIGMFSTVCYDGQYMIDSDHPLESGSTQDNSNTIILNEVNYGTLRAQLAGLKTYKGVLVHQTLTGLLLLHGPSNRAMATKILGQKGAGQALTGYEGDATPIEVSAFSGLYAAYWAVVRPRFGLMPFIISREQGPESANMISFLRPKLLWGIDSSDNAGYGLYETIVASTGAGV